MWDFQEMDLSYSSVNVEPGLYSRDGSHEEAGKDRKACDATETKWPQFYHRLHVTSCCGPWAPEDPQAPGDPQVPGCEINRTNRWRTYLLPLFFLFSLHGAIDIMMSMAPSVLTHALFLIHHLYYTMERQYVHRKIIFTVIFRKLRVLLTFYWEISHNKIPALRHNVLLIKNYSWLI